MRQVLGAGALGRPRGIGWRGRWEGGSGWGINVGSFVGKFLCEIFELRGSVVLRFIINQPCVSRIWNIFH